MVAHRVSSDEEEPDLIRHSLPKDTAAQEVSLIYLPSRYLFLDRILKILLLHDLSRCSPNINWKL